MLKFNYRKLKPMRVNIEEMETRDYTEEELKKVIEYLTIKNETIATSPGAKIDIFDKERKWNNEISLDLKSDGEYNWPESYAYYVKTYHMALPDYFLEKIFKK